MEKFKYKVTCFQCKIDFISEKILLECSRCKSRFVENIKMERIAFTSRICDISTSLDRLTLDFDNLID